jgi:hypothetical protein
MIDGNARTGVVAIDQFDLQDPTAVMRGYGDGWYEPEHNPTTGQTWRWSSERAALRTTTVDRDLVLQLTGESPLKYFNTPSSVTVKAGSLSLFSSTAAADFSWSIPIPASALRQSGGQITIESNQSFRPADRGQNADKRALALRIYSATLKPVSGPGTAANSRTAIAPRAAPALQR